MTVISQGAGSSPAGPPFKHKVTRHARNRMSCLDEQIAMIQRTIRYNYAIGDLRRADAAISRFVYLDYKRRVLRRWMKGYEK